MVLYWPNFSLMFLIHLFLYAVVYCIRESSYQVLVRIYWKSVFYNNKFELSYANAPPNHGNHNGTWNMNESYLPKFCMQLHTFPLT